MNTAEEFWQSKNGGKSSEEATEHGELITPSYAITLIEEFTQQNTLNRDKVMEILESNFGIIYSPTNIAPIYGIDKIYFDKIADAICSFSLPALSEDKIKNLWDKLWNDFSDISHIDESGVHNKKVGTMSFNDFKVAVYELTKPKEG